MIARKVVFCITLVEMLNGQNVGSVGLNVTATLRALRPKGFRAYIYEGKSMWYSAYLELAARDIHHIVESTSEDAPVRSETYVEGILEDLCGVVNIAGCKFKVRTVPHVFAFCGGTSSFFIVWDVVGQAGDVDTNVLIFNGVLYGFLEKGKKQVWGIAVKQANGGWLFEDPDLTLNVGPTVGSRISYRIFLPDQLTALVKEGDKMSYKLKGVETDLVEFQVSKLEDPSAPEPSCLPTVTKVRGRRRLCAGDVIFEDNFDTLQEDLWQIEQYIPFDHPDHPFISYQRLTSDPNVFVENGALHIVLKLQQDLFRGQESILSGGLDLSDGCTRSLCSKQAFGADILPPIVSGRLTSYSFSFTYGTVYVRAKVPKGDWLYPEILLEPLFKKYGGKFGGKYNLPEILKVTLADGNRVNNGDYALVYQIFNRAQLGLGNCGATNTEMTTHSDHEYWGDDFHVYALRWTPDEIKLTVDGDKYFYWKRPSLCEDITSAFDYLHLTLGVAAGGDTMFPDNSTNGNGRDKPWRNGDPKASLHFWEELHSWLSTWTRPSLIIDYVKVVAL